jgi:hypothetical protein
MDLKVGALCEDFAAAFVGARVFLALSPVWVGYPLGAVVALVGVVVFG